MNRVASKPYLPGHPGNYPIHNPNTHFVTSSDQAKRVIQPFHQHPVRLWRTSFDEALRPPAFRRVERRVRLAVQ